MQTNDRVLIVESPDAIEALAHPVRLRIIDALRRPGTAADVSRRIGQSRQNVAYHVRELEELGVVRKVEERRKGNFIEQVYESVAGTIVFSPRATWTGPERANALHDQVSLGALVALGEQVHRDAIALLDRAAFDGEEIPSASIDAQVRFPDEAARAAFMDDYLRLLGPLLKKHGGRRGSTYRVAVAVYPDVEEE